MNNLNTNDTGFYFRTVTIYGKYKLLVIKIFLHWYEISIISHVDFR